MFPWHLKRAKLACTIFCVCKASVTCFNDQTNDDDVSSFGIVDDHDFKSSLDGNGGSGDG